MTQKHAYLIMAHHELYVLKQLLSALDHERHDFFLHIDSKSVIKPSQLQQVVTKGNLYFTQQTDVHWGGYSQINAELVLLQMATATGKYAYYHLLTGVDLPLKSPNQLLQFFDTCGGVEFISFNTWTPKDNERVLFKYPFQDTLYRGFWEKKLRRAGVLWQRLVRYTRPQAPITNGLGSAYFDITDAMARYVCAQKQWIQHTFKDTFCADEVFLQTLYLNMPHANKRFESHLEDTFIEKTYHDVLRAIDWKRGDPYTYTMQDFSYLVQSPFLFARKFSAQKDKQIIDELMNHIRHENSI